MSARKAAEQQAAEVEQVMNFVTACLRLNLVKHHCRPFFCILLSATFLVFKRRLCIASFQKVNKGLVSNKLPSSLSTPFITHVITGRPIFQVCRQVNNTLLQDTVDGGSPDCLT